MSRKKAIFVANTGFALFNFRLSLMKYLSSQGWSVVAVANDEADYVEKFAHEGFKFINIFIDHKGKNFISDLLFTFRLLQLYKKESPDLVHHFTIKPVIFGSLAAKLAGVPAIVNTITGLGYVFGKGGFLMQFVILLYKFVLSERPKVIFQNNDDFSLFVSKSIVKKNQGQIILGSGVNTNKIFPINKKNNDNTSFVFISRMLWSKGVRELVRAAESVRQQFPDAVFVMAGGVSGGGAIGNPDAISEEWLCDVNKSGHVKWIGRISFDEVMSLLDQCSVFVLPSYYPEGVPRCLIEAAAKGKPIITTDTPGCREVVEHGTNGFLVPPKNVNILVEYMIKFIREPDLVTKMGIASRKRAEELFDERKVFSQTILVYKETGVF